MTHSFSFFHPLQDIINNVLVGTFRFDMLFSLSLSLLKNKINSLIIIRILFVYISIKDMRYYLFLFIYLFFVVVAGLFVLIF